MKLIAKAKPVRIRITSGNEEHNSLESLQKNFVWKDVAMLFDGRLVKWLKRINESEVADRLTELSKKTNLSDDILGVYNALFRKDSPFIDIEEVFTECLHDNSITSLAEELVSRLSTSELIKYGFRFSGLWNLFAEQLARISSTFTGNESGQELFSVGEFLYNDELYNKEGKRCILLAVKRGYRAAYNFKKKNNIVDAEDLEIILKSKDTINTLARSWANNAEIPLIAVRGTTKIVYDFSNVCLKLYRKSKTGYSEDLQSIANKYFEYIGNNDPLYQEKRFIIALFDDDERIAKRNLQVIVDEYPPAKAIIRYGKFELDGHTYELCSGFVTATHLKFFVKNLLRFRNYA